MTSNYTLMQVPQGWADSRETHDAVAAAIFAIAGPTRSPETIWEAPTSAEIDHVTMAVEDFLRNGHFAETPDGKYAWGEEAIEIDLLENEQDCPCGSGYPVGACPNCSTL